MGTKIEETPAYRRSFEAWCNAGVSRAEATRLAEHEAILAGLFANLFVEVYGSIRQFVDSVGESVDSPDEQSTLEALKSSHFASVDTLGEVRAVAAATKAALRDAAIARKRAARGQEA